MPEVEIIEWLKREFPSSRPLSKLYELERSFDLKLTHESFTHAAVMQFSFAQNNEFCTSFGIKFLNGGTHPRNLCKYEVTIYLDIDSKLQLITHGVSSVTEEKKVRTRIENIDPTLEVKWQKSLDYLEKIIKELSLVKGRIIPKDHQIYDGEITRNESYRG